MPGGRPVWHAHLVGQELDILFGFIEAYIECPHTIKSPFLPYRDKNDTLLFPTGELIGVYYSEEFKYAKSIGYTVIPLSGYLFEKKGKPHSEPLPQGQLEERKSHWLGRACHASNRE